nr:MAG TPA: hypothetical protein [Caudoviricetes sp.]
MKIFKYLKNFKIIELSKILIHSYNNLLKFKNYIF